MTALSDVLEALLAEHDRVRSPLRRYLRRPGVGDVAVRASLPELMPADETIEFFGWQDGIDQARWLRDGGGMTTFAPVTPRSTWR